jgi:hypothetical protein
VKVEKGLKNVSAFENSLFESKRKIVKLLSLSPPASAQSKKPLFWFDLPTAKPFFKIQKLEYSSSSCLFWSKGNVINTIIVLFRDCFNDKSIFLPIN